MGGAAAAGPRAALGAGGGGGTALPLEDPLDSDWHKQLVSLLWFLGGPPFLMCVCAVVSSCQITHLRVVVVVDCGGRLWLLMLMVVVDVDGGCC